MKVLVLCDDYWHPGEVIEAGLKPLEGEFAIDYVRDAKDMLTREMLEEYGVIVCCKSNQINGANQNPWFQEEVTEVMPEDFEDWVRQGGGFLFLHAGNTYRDGELLSGLSGNSFTGHPPRCRVDLETIPHPVTEGVGAFSLRDEHYQIVLTAQDASIFLKSRSEKGGEQVAGYTRSFGEGRVCVLTPGHILEVWRQEAFLRLVRQAIEWCGRER